MDKAIAQRLRDARSVEYCAFKACPGVGAFGRDDLRWAFSRDRRSPLDVSPSGGAPFVAPVDREAGAALVVAASLEHEDAPRRLETFARNACDWRGPVVLVAQLTTDKAFEAVTEYLARTLAGCGRVGRPGAPEPSDGRDGAEPETTLVLARVGPLGGVGARSGTRHAGWARQTNRFRGCRVEGTGHVGKRGRVQ